MPGRLGAELAERLDVVQADRRLPERLVVGVDRLRPGQVQQRVEQHRGVPGREHEAVAVGPDRVRRVEAQEALPERVGDRGHRHRRSRVAGVGLLDRVDRQRPDRVDAERVEVGRLGLSDRRHLEADASGPAARSAAGPRKRARRFPAVSAGAEAEREKRAAAEAAAELVEDGMAVGLGTGSTVAHLLPALAARGLGIRCVATSPETERAARELGRSRSSRSTGSSELDIAIDGADQVAPDGWLVKGGGGAHLREKIVAAAAERFVVVVDSGKAGGGALPAGAAGALVLRAQGDASRARRGRSSATLPRAPMGG